jgi:hypothetical protein
MGKSSIDSSRNSLSLEKFWREGMNCMIRGLIVAVFVGSLITTHPVDAGSVRLINDSSYVLRAVIRARDNSYLGEVVINPQGENIWDDGFQGLPGSLESVRSQTPYRVLWYCLDGNSFSTCPSVSTGSVVTATYCDGARECRGKKWKEGESHSEEVESPDSDLSSPQNQPASPSISEPSR